MSDVFFNPFEPGFFEDPYGQYERLRVTDPVHRSPLEIVVLFRYEDCFRLLRDPTLSVEDVNARPTARTEAFAATVGGEELARRQSRAMLNLDPPDHTRLRKLVSKAFTPRRIEQLRPRVTALVEEALDAVAARHDGSMDVIADLAFPLPFTVISELLGMPESTTDRSDVRAWSHAMTATLDPILSEEQVQAAMAAADSMVAYLGDVLVWKREHPDDDLLTGLLVAEDEGDRLSEDDVLDQVLLLFIAGHETTVNLIGNGVLALLRNPAACARLRDDPSLDAGAVEELLRYDSPVQFSRRITTADVELGGVPVEAGTFVLTCLGAANRDPAMWGASAGSLDVGREGAAQHLSFGSGVHHCLGAALARLEGQEAIGRLVRRFPGLAFASDDGAGADAGAGVVRNDRIVLRGLDRLPVTLAG